MIEVYPFHRKDRYSLKVLGHANYAELGNDIVCAAVSSLVQSYAYFCKEEGAYILELEIEPGAMVVDVLGNDNVAAAYRMVKLGLNEIEKAYPGYVRNFHEKN